MKAIGWFIAYVAALIMEMAVLPQWLGGWVPTLGAPVLLLGFVFQRFWPGLVFAGLAGLFRDALGNGNATYTLLILGTFFVIHATGILLSWGDEPWRRIGSVGAGLAATPFLWFLTTRFSRSLFGSAAAAPVVPNDAWAISPAMHEVAFMVVWFSVFVWVTIRRARVTRARRLERL